MTQPPSIPTIPPAATPGGDRFTILLGDARDAGEPWHRTACGLLGAQGVRTVVAENGRGAIDLIERGLTGDGPRIHVAVLEQRMRDMTALQLLKRLREPSGGGRGPGAGDATSPRSDDRPAPPAPLLPPAILLAHANDREGGLSSNFMHDALTVRVFSVLPRPVDMNLLLDTLARALRRFYAGRWPGSDQNHQRDGKSN